MRIRLLPFANADGATNMAADEVMLHSAAAGIASLRFYGWSAATVSLGYFQAHQTRFADPHISALPWVRRPSGGATLVHHHELTYALALPPGDTWQGRDSWLLRMHRIIVAALTQLGLANKLQIVEDKPIKHGDVLCFQQFTVGDVLCAKHKVIGSAQRKFRQALMQHGSILLTQSEYTPSLPGIAELTGNTPSSVHVRGAIVLQFPLATPWNVEAGDWTESEKMEITTLAGARYSSADWNERR
jgi:lipoate-protein ligase A